MIDAQQNIPYDAHLDTQQVDNPYVGPRSFEEKDSANFFGRDEESRQLTSLVIAHRTVLLHAQSGAGKTSLLQASVIPELKRRKRVVVLPSSRVGGELPSGIKVEQVTNIYTLNTLLNLQDETVDLVQLPKLDLTTGLQPYMVQESDERRLRPRLLILDQFEELFTSHPDRFQERSDFMRQLQEALIAYPQLSLLLSMRDDHIARLDRYVVQLPDRLRTRFHMDRLDFDGALAAVATPAERAGRPFAEGVAEELVNNLRRVQVATLPLDQNGSAQRYGAYIEPVHLQIVCRQLWANLPPDRSAILAEDVQEFGDVDHALIDFYNNALQQAVRATSVSERQLRTWFSEKLITPAGTRSLVYRDTTETAGLPNAAVDLLRDAYIIRADTRGGDIWYELAHDRLVEPILTANRARQTSLALDAQGWLVDNRNPDNLYEGQQLRDVATELEEHPERFSELEREFVQVGLDKERKYNDRRRQLMTIGAILIILLLAILSSVTYNSSVNARRSEATALAAQGTADALRQESVATATVAIANATAAIVAKENADEQRGIAEQARVEAIAAQQRAISARIVAEQQRQIAQVNQLAADSILSLGLDNQLDRSLLLAVEAVEAARTINNQRSPAAEEALRRALRQAGADPVLVATGDAAVQAAGFRADARSLILWQENTLAQSSALDENRSELTFTVTLTKSATTAQISPNSHWLVLVEPGEARQAQLRDLTNPATLPVTLRTSQSTIPMIAFSNNEHWLVLGGVLVEVWDLTNLRDTPTFTREAGSPPASVAISSDGRWLAAASQSAFIRLWDLQSNAEPVLLNGHEDIVQAMLITPEQQWLISGSDDNTIRFWPLLDGTMSEIVLRGHEGPVTALALSPDGGRLATGSSDQSLRIWNLNKLSEKPLVLRGHTAALRQIGFGADDQWMFSIDQGNTLLLWRDQIDDLVRLACTQAGRNLTVQEWWEFMSEPAYRQTCPDLPEPEIQLRYSNRDVIYAFLAAGRELNLDSWNLLQNANLFRLLFHYSEPYTGPNIADLPGLTLEQQEVVRRKLLREADQNLTTTTYLWRKSELLTIPLGPPESEQMASPTETTVAAQSVANLWNRFGSLLAAIAMELEIDPDIPVAWLMAQSAGNNSGPDGRILIRFENHIFYNEWGKAHTDIFADHFRFNADIPWQGHQWRADPTQPWQEVHSNQTTEWQAYEFARALDDTAAKRSISVGASQVMGFNHGNLGFQSVQDMFSILASPSVGERNGMFIAFDFFSSTPVFIESLRQRDFVRAATLYKGSGQADFYAQLLQNWASLFNELRNVQQPLFVQGDAVVSMTEVPVWVAAGQDDEPERTLISHLPVGAAATVINGPLQIDDLVWWQIQFLDETARSMKGWVVQSDAAGLPQLEKVVHLPQPQPAPIVTPGTETASVTNLTSAGDFVVTTQAVSVWPAPRGESTELKSEKSLGAFDVGVNLIILESQRSVENITWWRVGGITPSSELVGWIPGVTDDGKETIALPPKLPGTNIPDKATRSYLGAPFGRAYGVSQLFGENAAFYRQITYDGVPLKGRNGVDFLTPLGTPILAVDAGTVLRAENDSNTFGNFVLLQHSWGESFYTQLDTLAVAPGDQVPLGQIIGQSGNSGMSAGPHLGFSIRINPYDRADGWGGFSDPLPYLNPNVINLPSYIFMGYSPRAATPF